MGKTVFEYKVEIKEEKGGGEKRGPECTVSYRPRQVK